jgi:hypothetical protein
MGQPSDIGVSIGSIPQEWSRGSTYSRVSSIIRGETGDDPEGFFDVVWPIWIVKVKKPGLIGPDTGVDP